MQSKLRFVNATGHPKDTDVLDAVTGERVPNVMKARIDVDRGTIKATVQLAFVGFDLVTNDITPTELELSRTRWNVPLEKHAEACAALSALGSQRSGRVIAKEPESVMNAYARYDADPRAHGPEDFAAFSDAITFKES